MRDNEGTKEEKRRVVKDGEEGSITLILLPIFRIMRHCLGIDGLNALNRNPPNCFFGSSLYREFQTENGITGSIAKVGTSRSSRQGLSLFFLICQEGKNSA